jgi:hypothetical protein
VVALPETCARVGVEHGDTGFRAPDLAAFAESVVQLMDSEPLRQRMGAAARIFSCSKMWNGVFEQLYCTYEKGLDAADGKAGDRAIAESQTTS